MIEPIHIATMGEHQLRFFRRPINDGMPDFPWHSVDDLYSCLGLNREQRRVFLRKLKEFGGTQPWRRRTASSPSRRTTWRKAASMRWSRKAWRLTAPAPHTLSPRPRP